MCEARLLFLEFSAKGMDECWLSLVEHPQRWWWSELETTNDVSLIRNEKWLTVFPFLLWTHNTTQKSSQFQYYQHWQSTSSWNVFVIARAQFWLTHFGVDQQKQTFFFFFIVWNVIPSVFELLLFSTKKFIFFLFLFFSRRVNNRLLIN